MEEPPKLLTIRVTGLGHKVTLKDLPSVSTTVADLRTKVFEATGLPPRFQKFIGPQKLIICNSGDGNSTINSNNEIENQKSMADLGIKDRTRLMLLHSPLYQTEKDTYEQLKAIQDEIKTLEASIQEKKPEVLQKQGYVSEMVTRICCRLDAIETAGSKDLRAHRKELIQTAEGLESSMAAETEPEPKKAKERNNTQGSC